MTAAARPVVRCAIYTRKSSEEGLDQAFNSLHAQGARSHPTKSLQFFRLSHCKQGRVPGRGVAAGA